MPQTDEEAFREGYAAYSEGVRDTLAKVGSGKLTFDQFRQSVQEQRAYLKQNLEDARSKMSPNDEYSNVYSRSYNRSLGGLRALDEAPRY